VDTKDYEYDPKGQPGLTTEEAMANIEQGFKDRAECNSILMEAFGGEPSEPMTGAQINAELEPTLARLYPQPEPSPTTVYSFGFEAEEVLTLYAALRSYLRMSASQDSEDLETLARVVKLLKDMRPRAVRASKELSLKAAEVRHGE
jgi:hypothetical protein